MTIPSLPAQGAPWLAYAQGLDAEVRSGRLSDDALRAAFAARGEAAQSVQASLPNFTTLLRSYDDVAAPAVRIIGFGSSVGDGDTLPDPDTQAPVARFASRLDAAVNQLNNLNLVTTNASVDGSIITDFNNTHYAAGKTEAGGTPTIALLCFGMNDGIPGQYHTGQTFPGVYLAMREAITKVLNDGGDPIVVTTPHPHTGRYPWTASSGGTYAVGAPAYTDEGSVVTADWLGNGRPVPASYRHKRVNDAMRAAAVELGVPVIDAERYWFAAVAEHGEDALFNTGEYVHPNLLGHMLSYWLAIDAFMRGLQAAVVSASVPRLPREEIVLLPDTAYRWSSALSDDVFLKVPVMAGDRCVITATLFYSVSVAVDMKVQFSAPDGSLGNFGTFAAGEASTGFAGGPVTVRSSPWNSWLPIGGIDAAAVARVEAVITAGADGVIALQWAQINDDGGNPATLFFNSIMRVRWIE